jgi:hypothetical protein
MSSNNRVSAASRRDGFHVGKKREDRRVAGGDRLPPRRRPPGAMGAAGAEAAAEAGCPVEPDTSRDPAAGGSLEMVLKLAAFVGPAGASNNDTGSRDRPTRPPADAGLGTARWTTEGFHSRRAIAYHVSILPHVQCSGPSSRTKVRRSPAISRSNRVEDGSSSSPMRENPCSASTMDYLTT